MWCDGGSLRNRRRRSSPRVSSDRCGHWGLSREIRGGWEGARGSEKSSGCVKESERHVSESEDERTSGEDEHTSTSVFLPSPPLVALPPLAPPF